MKRDSLGSGDRERVLSDRSEKSEAGDMSIDDAEVEEVLFGLDNAFEGAKHMVLVFLSPILIRTLTLLTTDPTPCWESQRVGVAFERTAEGNILSVVVLHGD